jgi:hypothetical protein
MLPDSGEMPIKIAIVTKAMSEEQHTDDRDTLKEREAHRQAIHENAKQIFRESGIAEMLQDINRNLLKGRGHFEEYDSMVLFRWGTSSTLRHMWIEVDGNTLRFRLQAHRKCKQPAPLCDGEYHTFTSAMWLDRAFLSSELKKYYDRPVAEPSSD